MKKSSISASTASANAFVRSVSFMVTTNLMQGKHKDHDVKTIRKSQPMIKSEVDKYIDQFNNNVETLLIKKS